MYIKIDPFSRINDKVHWSAELSNLYNTSRPNSIIYDNIDFYGIVSPEHIPDMQRSFLYVCTETVFHYPHSYLTEKSFKGILSKRPFVIVGPTGSIELLKSYGFKTFDNWWSEDYDSEQDPNRRIEKVFAIIKYVCSKTTTELHSLCLEMESVLEYNFNHYSTFGLNEVQSFDQACLKNLKR